jgi:hypothetical protein
MKTVPIRCLASIITQSQVVVYFCSERAVYAVTICLSDLIETLGVSMYEGTESPEHFHDVSGRYQMSLSPLSD